MAMASNSLPSQIMVGDGDVDTTSCLLTTTTGKFSDNEGVQGSPQPKSVVTSPARVNKIIIPHNAVIMLNGRKCVLKVDGATGTLNAYPIRDNAVLDAGQVLASSLVPATGEDRDNHAAQGLLQLSSRTDAATECQNVTEGNQALMHANQTITTSPLAVTPRFIIPDVTSQNNVKSVPQSTSQPVHPPASYGNGVGSETGSVKLHAPLSTIRSESSLVAIKPESSLVAIKPEVRSAEASGKATSPTIQERREPIKIGLKTSESDLERLRCTMCSHQSFYLHQHQDHLRQVHADVVQYCKCCSHVAPDDETMTRHYSEVHPRNICDQCGLTSEHAYIIKRHMHRHNTDGCECEVCGKTYKDQYILKMHIKMVHTPPDVLYECSTCTKKFTRKAHLKRHQRIHSSEKPFKCPHCDYRGCERSDISKHVLIHDDPQHVCDVCGKAFRHMKNKELHLKRHKGQRDYKCGVCDFYGYTFTDIRKHIERKHTEFKSVVCERCGQFFKTEAAMQEHRLSWHQGDEAGCDGNAGCAGTVLGIASTATSAVVHGADDVLLVDMADHDHMEDNETGDDEDAELEQSDSTVIEENFESVELVSGRTVYC